MQENNPFGDFLSEFLTKQNKEKVAVRSFGENFRNKAEAIYQTLPQNPEENMYVSGEVIKVAEPKTVGFSIYPESVYHFGAETALSGLLGKALFEAVDEYNQANIAELRAAFEEKFNQQFQLDMPDLYDEMKEELEGQILANQTKGGITNWATPENSVILGTEPEPDLNGAFLIRISHANLIGKMFIVPKNYILTDEGKALEELAAAIAQAFPPKEAATHQKIWSAWASLRNLFNRRGSDTSNT